MSILPVVKFCINCDDFCNDEQDSTYKKCGGSYCKKYMRMVGANGKCIVGELK